MQGLDILLPAFVLCILMLLTHSYFGLHVLSRGIIFVDLALAQVAALGISIAFLLGEETHGNLALIYAFIATLIASALFAKLRYIPSKVTREVAIGCVYVVATALTIVILSRSSQGMEELKSIFNGNIMWVSWDELRMLALLYLLVMILHIVYRQRFFDLSFADHHISSAFIWEFLFFSSFAIIITLAVNLAGILMVFAFLIIPAFSASLLSKNYRTQLLLAWLCSLLSSLAGLFLAFNLDLPVGATIVTTLGVVPLFIGLYVWQRNKREIKVE